MAARDSLKICFSKLLSSLLPAALMVLLSSTSGFARELPQVELLCPAGIQLPATPFEISIIISWKGDAEAHLVIPPEPVFPENFTVRASSFKADVSNAHHQLTYHFTLVSHQTGQFTVYPVAIRFWPRSSSTELSLITKECSITIKDTKLRNKKIAAVAAAILLFIIFVGISIRRKHSGIRHASPHTEPEPSGTLLIQQCRAHYTRGNYTAFYTTALQAAQTLLPSDHELNSQITASQERTRFSGEEPSAENAEYILRRLESACDKKP